MGPKGIRLRETECTPSWLAAPGWTLWMVSFVTGVQIPPLTVERCHSPEELDQLTWLSYPPFGTRAHE